MNKKVRLTEQQLRSIIKEKVNHVLEEGIDFDYATKTVSYNPSHENNVDTSIENNPTVDETLVDGVRVWSIFKRKQGNKGDGNPLVYALKNEAGWTFTKEQDKIDIEKQFDAIASKFASLYPIGVTILIPSTNGLNKHIADVVMSKSENAKLVTGLICKLTTEEVADIALEFGSKFREYYKKDFNAKYEKLLEYLETMNQEHDGCFCRHLIKDPKMRDVLDCTLKVTEDKYAKYAKCVNGEDVLIIDDTISRGQTIQAAVDALKTSYAPKSITVLTLLSKLYEQPK